MTYEIQDIPKLKNDTDSLSEINGKIKDNTASLSTNISQIKDNWTNEEGQDLASILNELEFCVKQLSEVITPTIEEYVSTMYTLAEASEITQNQTL